MPRLSADELRSLTRSIFAAAGARDGDAELVADGLVDAELCGHPSHGLTRVGEYLGHIREGVVDPSGAPEVVSDRGATLVVDGHWGFGQVVAGFATDRLVERAREHGTAVVAVRNCAHVGRVGAYPELAAREGLVAMAFVNGGGNTARLAPHGAARAAFGTNPLAAAVPVPGQDPVVVDFSTAVVASGKIRVLRDRGESLPEGWILDREGHPSTQPEDYYDGGMLLPAAAHKGSALALLVEVLAGCVTGAGSLAMPDSGYRLGNGMLLQAFDVSALIGDERYAALARSLAETLRASPPAAGHDRVLLPGDPEREARERHEAEGVDVAESTWRKLLAAADELGVAVS